MRFRYWLRSSTTICASASLATGALAADLRTEPPPLFMRLPAVDGINSKFEAFGGGVAVPSYRSPLLDANLLPNAGGVTGGNRLRSTAGGAGAISFPIGNSFGLQVEGMGATFANRSVAGVGGHLFWRDPAKGLLGLYASGTYSGAAAGIGVARVAAEGEAYFGPFTFEGIVGIESGRSHRDLFGGMTTTGVPYVGYSSYNMSTRFFDKVSVAWYPLEDLKLSVGQLYTGRRVMATLGAEYMFPISHGVSGSLFADGAIGGNGTGSIRGGLKVYFGRADKTLIRRHREDDPIINLPLDLITLANTRTTSVAPLPVPVPAKPPVCVGVMFEGACIPGG